jgi:hypothetical protein
MRKVALALLCGLVAVPAAVAALRAPNDGVIELGNVNAWSLTLSGTRGTVWGQMDRGKLIVTDPIVGDGKIYVSGAEKTRIVPVDDGTVTVYTGTDIHFRVTGGKYKLAFRPTGLDTGTRGVDLTAVGVGVADVTGDAFATKTGDYSIDGGDWTPVPQLRHLIPYGTPTTVTTTTTS